MITYIICGVVAVLLVVLISSSYVKAPPSFAFVISGLNKEPRVLIGKGGFRVPGLERLDKVYLGQITVDVDTEGSVPTNDFLDVIVSSVAKIRVVQTPEGIRLAAKNFLNMTSEKISEQVRATLQGNLREIIGTMDLKSLNINREGFSQAVTKSATPDMDKLGIEILSFNIQNISDKDGLIRDLGADNTASIRKAAAINKANATRDIKIQEAIAEREANEARVEADTAIAEKNNELELKKAALKKQSDAAKAEADAAYEIQKQIQQKTINISKSEAEIELKKQQQIISNESIKIKENELTATVNKQAEADKYKTQVNAEAELEQRKRKAEAERYEKEQQAAARNAEADAIRYAQEQKALGIKAEGEAEAAAIEAKGKAEAAAIEAKAKAEAAGMKEKAEAFKQYNDAAVTQMLIDKLPEVANSVSSAIAGIKGINIYSAGGGDGEGAIGSVSGNVPVVIKQVFDTMESVTGVPMAELVKAHTIEAKTTRKIQVDDALAEVADEILESAKKK
jgi:flotillin